MSEKVARLAVSKLRTFMFPQLPVALRAMFPLITDPLVKGDTKVPNIVVGDQADFGANTANTAMVTVNAEGATDGIVNVYRHIQLNVDIWASQPNVDGRRVASIIYEYVFNNLCNTNWTGDGIAIQRSYEIERSPVLFEPQNKIYHISNKYRVEAISETWY